MFAGYALYRQNVKVIKTKIAIVIYVLMIILKCMGFLDLVFLIPRSRFYNIFLGHCGRGHYY